MLTDTEKIVEEAIESGEYDHVDEEVLRAYVDNIGDLEHFEDHYLGTYEGSNEDDAIGEMLYGIYDHSTIPDNLRYYIDWEKMGRDSRFGGEVWTERVGVDEYAIFSNY
jgi:antirestriction protein